MIDADQRSGFRKPIALNHGIAEASPELFRFRRQGGSSGNDGPEFPAEAAMDAAKRPPAFQKMLALPIQRTCGETLQLRHERCRVAFNVFLQRFDQPRHGYQHRNAFIVNGSHDFRWIQAVGKHRSRSENLRQKNPEHLAEHVAERKQIQKAQRMEDAFVAAVFVDFPLDGLKVREDVAMGQHDAARFSSGARREDDLNGIASRLLARARSPQPDCVIARRSFPEGLPARR